MDFREGSGVLNEVLLRKGSCREHKRCFQGILEVSGVIYGVQGVLGVCEERLGVLEVSGIVEKFEGPFRSI